MNITADTLSNTFAIVNDSFITTDKASLLVNDMAIQRAYGVFDFLRTINGKFVHVDDHLDRFIYSASQMRLQHGKTKEQLKQLLDELAAKNKLPDSGIRITLTGGYSEDGYSIATPNLIIYQKPLLVNKQNQQDGIRLVSYEHQRQLPHLKTIDYIMAIWLRPFIAQHNADDVIYHKEGSVTECPRSNVFIVTKDDRIVTPANNILKGITRKHIIEAAKNHFIVEEKDVTIDDILQAKEAFITSTTKQLLPIFQLDGNKVGNGKSGEITMSLREQTISLISP